jgi:hypothetical protein
MSTSLDFYVCFNTDREHSPTVMSYLSAYLDDGFLERLEPALRKARPLRNPVINCVPNNELEKWELEMTHDAHDEPLTYILPEDLDEITDTHPANQAVLDYITKNTFRYALMVVLYWH